MLLETVFYFPLSNNVSYLKFWTLYVNLTPVSFMIEIAVKDYFNSLWNCIPFFSLRLLGLHKKLFLSQKLKETAVHLLLFTFLMNYNSGFDISVWLIIILHIF